MSTLSAYATVLPIVTARKKTKGQDTQSTTPPQPLEQCHSQSSQHDSLIRYPWISTLWHYAKGIWNFVTFLLQLAAMAAAVALYFRFSPNISISPVSTFQSSDAFSVPFIISNNGYWDFHDVQTTCSLKDVQFKGIDLRNSAVRTEKGAAHVLSPGEGLTVTCEMDHFLNAPDMKLQSADIGMVVTFRIFLYGKQTRSFRFIAAQDRSNQWHWLPQPIAK